MNLMELHKVATAMVAPGKGILAADESSGTIKKRFDGIGAEGDGLGHIGGGADAAGGDERNHVTDTGHQPLAQLCTSTHELCSFLMAMQPRSCGSIPSRGSSPRKPVVGRPR